MRWNGHARKKIIVNFYLKLLIILIPSSGAQQFSQEANFDEIPLPSGISIPEAASTPYSSNSGAIGPQIPGQMQAAMKAGILKKTTTAKKQHKHPPGF